MAAGRGTEAALPRRGKEEHQIEDFGPFVLSYIRPGSGPAKSVSCSWNRHLLLTHPDHPGRDGASCGFNDRFTEDAALICLKRWLVVGLGFWLAGRNSDLDAHFRTLARNQKTNPSASTLQLVMDSGWLSESDLSCLRS